MLHHIVYTSLEVPAFDGAALRQLLLSARARNHAFGFTGLLLYCEGRFVQVLEGPRHPLEELYARIRRDPRHREVETLSDGPTAERLFPDWRMGFAAADPADVAGLLGYADPRRPNLLLPPRSPASPHLRELLQVYASALAPLETGH